MAWAICTLGSAAAFMLQYGDSISKASLIWVHTLMALVLLFHFGAPGSQYKLDSHRSRILRKLQSLQVHPDVLHFSALEKCNSVLCVLQEDFEFSHSKAGYNQPSSPLYVGSTAIGVTKRHLYRAAVFRRLKQTELVDAELALIYWPAHDNLFEFVRVLLCSFQEYQSAWSFVNMS